MSLFSRIRWKLMSGDARLRYLKKRGLIIGSGCEILNGYDFGSEPYLIEIGDNVRITAGVKITTHDGGMWVLRNLYPEFKSADKFGRVKIGSNCHIGMNSMIMPGVTIGNNCIIGAGAIVTHDIPSNSIAVGIPARVIESISEYGEKYRGKTAPTKQMSWSEKREWVEDHILNNSSIE